MFVDKYMYIILNEYQKSKNVIKGNISHLNLMSVKNRVILEQFEYKNTWQQYIKSLQQEMWSLETQRSQDGFIQMVSTQTIILFGLFLLGLRIVIQKILTKYFMVSVPKPEHNQNSLEYSYFYHLSIIILILTDVNWNIFDILIWLFSYVCIGMLRKAVHIAKVQKDTILNDYSYNNDLVTILWASKVYGITLFVFSVLYFIWVTASFNGIPMRITSLLLFPTMMLGVDSIFLFLCSVFTTEDLLCYYNQNINQVPTSYKLEVYHQIASSSIRVAHFFTIIRIFLKTFFEKFEVFNYIWILSVLNAGYGATMALIRSISEYSSLKKLMSKMNVVFRRASSDPGQICIICMEQLYNCRKISSCGHLFHFKCLFQWIKTKSECPVCRQPIRLG